jgi:ubiquinone biosynthesis protein COQ4
MVAVCGETTGQLAFERMYERMSGDHEGRQIIAERPVINSQSINYSQLRSLPVNTFGYQYALFMETNNISSDTRKPVKFIDSPEIAYICRRHRETHDLVHALLGMKTNMLCEVAVKWVEAIQTDLPMAWSAALFGPLRFGTNQRRQYTRTYLPWALKCGHQSKYLMNVYFEKKFEQDIDELRSELNIPDIQRQVVTVVE